MYQAAGNGEVAILHVSSTAVEKEASQPNYHHDWIVWVFRFCQIDVPKKGGKTLRRAQHKTLDGLPTQKTIRPGSARHWIHNPQKGQTVWHRGP
mmetsp:Transcript_29466/g.80973  ORF Transcript_29466/g.80973 Transcript_29466/m.80973 type:complete len:94 (-) Transcript_29466:80-361(-)